MGVRTKTLEAEVAHASPQLFSLGIVQRQVYDQFS